MAFFEKEIYVIFPHAEYRDNDYGRVYEPFLWSSECDNFSSECECDSCIYLKDEYIVYDFSAFKFNLKLSKEELEICNKNRYLWATVHNDNFIDEFSLEKTDSPRYLLNTHHGYSCHSWKMIEFGEEFNLI